MFPAGTANEDACEVDSRVMPGSTIGRVCSFSASREGGGGAGGDGVVTARAGGASGAATRGARATLTATGLGGVGGAGTGGFSTTAIWSGCCTVGGGARGTLPSNATNAACSKSDAASNAVIRAVLFAAISISVPLLAPTRSGWRIAPPPRP